MNKIKYIKLFTIISLTMFFIFCFNVKVEASTGGKTADQAIEYEYGKLGTWIGSGQCVAQVCDYAEWLGHPFRSGIQCAKDFATDELFDGGAMGGWQRIQGADAQKGDIIIYTNSGFGHIAIYESDYSTFHANWNDPTGRYEGTVVKHVTSYYKTVDSSNFTYWGVIRPDFVPPDSPPELKEYGVDVTSMTNNSIVAKLKASDDNRNY